MVAMNKNYEDLIQAIKDIFPAETPELEDADENTGFSLFFPEENLGFSLWVNDCRPISFVAFSQDIVDTNQRVSVMYEVNDDLPNFIGKFKTGGYEEIIGQLEYRRRELQKPVLFSRFFI